MDKGINRKQIIETKKRIVIKVGTTTITHPQTGNVNLEKLERFVRILINLRNKGLEVIVVSSGAVGVGRTALGMTSRPESIAKKQACAAVGQARLMMMYEKLFNEYSQLTAQVLLTKESVTNEECRGHARDTFEALLQMHVVPIVNENDAISVDELAYGNFGDNDTLAAYVARLVEADLLILMSDIDGLYTDDPKQNPHARFIHTVTHIDESLEQMAKGATTNLGTGGMSTKIAAAKMVMEAGVDMIIANGENIYHIQDIMAGKKIGTFFCAQPQLQACGNEMAPETAIYRRIAKQNRKRHLQKNLHQEENVCTKM
jgi:glutamate 5-kinase